MLPHYLFQKLKRLYFSRDISQLSILKSDVKQSFQLFKVISQSIPEFWYCSVIFTLKKQKVEEDMAKGAPNNIWKGRKSSTGLTPAWKEAMTI